MPDRAALSKGVGEVRAPASPNSAWSRRLFSCYHSSQSGDPVHIHMFCHKCGSQVSSDVRFCPNCGESLPAPGGGGAPAVPWTPPAGVKAESGRWISEGWQLVKADMGNYVIMALVFSLLNGMVPFILQGPLIVG